MKIRTALRLAWQGLAGLWRTRFLGSAAFTTVVLALGVMGIFLVFLANLSHLAQGLEERVQLRVFLVDGLSPEAMAKVGEQIRAHPEVTRAIFVSRSEALERLKRQFAGREEVFELVEENPLPDSYVVQPEPGTDWEKLSRALAQIEGVERATYGEEIVRRALLFLRMTTVATLAAAAFLAVAITFIIMNVIRLTVYARRREIEIMRLVGASDSYIYFPFLCEGFFLGFFGAALAALGVDRAYLWLSEQMARSIPFLPLLGRDLFWLQAMTVLIGLGALMGVVGSYLSVKRFLRA